MAFSKNTKLEIVDQPPCTQLRSKAIYVMGEIGRPTHPDEFGSDACWCNLTQHVIGPDDGDVDRTTCVEGRHCFRST